MISASTGTITEYILYDAAGGASPKPAIKTEYYSDTASTWAEFEDVESRSIELSTDNKRYMSYSFMPPIKQMSLQLNNTDAVYSTGSGDPKASILKKNLKVRCFTGYDTTLREGDPYYFKRGTFVIDEPNYGRKVSIKGRDYLKKAIETEINLPDLLSSVPITTRLAQVFDRCSIPYDTANWDSISTACQVSNATLAESLTNVSGWKICDYLMDAINAGSDDVYFRFDENGNALIKTLETDIEADWATHYIYNIESITKNYDSDRQLQRMTMVNSEYRVNPETTLGSFTGTTASTALSLTYATDTNGTNANIGAMFVRYSDANGIINSESARGNTGVSFGVDSGAAYDINVYGCRPKEVATDIVWAEFGDSDNILKNDGSTFKKINPFFSQDMADEFVTYIVNRYADPQKTITLSEEVNPLLQVGIDNIMVFDKFTYTDDIYGVTSIQESWSNPSLKETILLTDRGFDLGNFWWDRNGLRSGVNDLKYDTGLIWDQDLGPAATGDTATYPKKNILS